MIVFDNKAHSLLVHAQGRTQDFLQGVSTGSRSKTWGSADADELFILVVTL